MKLTGTKWDLIDTSDYGDFEDGEVRVVAHSFLGIDLFGDEKFYVEVSKESDGSVMICLNHVHDANSFCEVGFNRPVTLSLGWKAEDLIKAAVSPNELEPFFIELVTKVASSLSSIEIGVFGSSLSGSKVSL